MAVCCVLMLAAAGELADSAESVRIVPIVSGGEVLVSFELADGYTADVREVIASGLLTTFTYEIELRMAVAGWMDRMITTAVVTASSQYDNLTRRHTLTRAIDGRVVDRLVTDDETAVKQWLTSLKRIPLCPTSKLDQSRDYFVRIRARRRPSGTSLLGLGSNVVAQTRFTFIP